MKLSRIACGVILLFQIALTSASEDAFIAIERMIAADYRGDPSARVKIALPDARRELEYGLPSSERKRIAFELDADPVILADGWSVERPGVDCNFSRCIFSVRFHVIATPHGFGVPSWDRNAGREFVIATPPVDKFINFTLINSGGYWKVLQFPTPVVSVDVMLEYLRSEQRTFSSTAPRRKSPESQRNLDIVLGWYQRQITTLSDREHGAKSIN